MFAQLFEPKTDLQVDQAGDLMFVVYSSTLKPEYRVGPFTEKFTGDWNVDLEKLNIELINDEPNDGSIVGSMSFTLTPIT